VFSFKTNGLASQGGGTRRSISSCLWVFWENPVAFLGTSFNIVKAWGGGTGRWWKSSSCTSQVRESGADRSGANGKTRSGYAGRQPKGKKVWDRADGRKTGKTKGNKILLMSAIYLQKSQGVCRGAFFLYWFGVVQKKREPFLGKLRERGLTKCLVKPWDSGSLQQGSFLQNRKATGRGSFG